MTDTSQSPGITLTQANVFDGLSMALAAMAGADPDPDSAIALKILSAIAKLGSLFAPDPVQSEINNLATAIHDEFVAVEATDAAVEIRNRMSRLKAYAQDAADALEDLQVWLQDQTAFTPGELVSKCQSSVNKFLNADDVVWNNTLSAAEIEKLSWSDDERQSTCWDLDVRTNQFVANSSHAGYGPQLPPLNDDGITVFDYRLTLPMYLWALGVYLSVVHVTRPAFLVELKADFVAAADRLQAIHDKVMQSGLVSLIPPAWMDDTILNIGCPISSTGEFARRPAIQLLYDTTGLSAHHNFNPPVTGAIIEYGAVDKYSAVSSVFDGYQLNFSTAGSLDPAYFNKLQIRVLKRFKDVYVGCGLRTVRQAIAHLRGLTGAQPPPGPDPADWSFRELMRLAQTPAKNGMLSFWAFAGFVIDTQPDDTQYKAEYPNVFLLSARKLLTNIGPPAPA